MFSERGSFRVRDHGEEDVGVPFNAEVKAPAAIDARLPDTAGLVVLLGVE